MCRWLAYAGTAIPLEELLVKRDRSLIDQSLHARQGATTTNGDGFGVGWYDAGETPRVYRSTHPAWNDRNLRELAAGISSPLFFAHIRASTGTAIQETNTHPFRYGRWLWMHNGLIRDFPRVKRELVLAVDDVALRVDRRHDRLGDDVLPRADVRARGRSTRRRRANGRLHRGDGPQARGGAPGADDSRDDRRDEGVGVPCTRASVTRDRSTSAPESTPSRLSTRRARSSQRFRTRPGSSSPSRSVTYRGSGTRFPESHFAIVQPGADELHPFTPRGG